MSKTLSAFENQLCGFWLVIAGKRLICIALLIISFSCITTAIWFLHNTYGPRNRGITTRHRNPHRHYDYSLLNRISIRYGEIYGCGLYNNRTEPATALFQTPGFSKNRTGWNSINPYKSVMPGSEPASRAGLSQLDSTEASLRARQLVATSASARPIP
jgi:hypothetical protein